MKKSVTIIIEGFAVFLLTLVVSTIFNYCTIPNGVIYVNNPVHISNNEYIATIEIVNYSNNLLKEIIIEVPGSINSVYSSTPLTYELSSSDTEANVHLLQVESIKENIECQIILQYEFKAMDNMISYSNIKSNKLDIQTYDNHLNPMKQRFTYALISSAIYGIFITIALSISSKQNEKRAKDVQTKSDELHKQISQARDELKEKVAEERIIQQNLRESIEKNYKEIMEEKAYRLKSRLLYESRISDYRKELDYWRDTIRKILYKECNPEDLYREIATSLKTYKTLKPYDRNNIDYISVATKALLNKNEQNDN